MKIKLLIFFSIIAFSINAFSSLPAIPLNCFSNNKYCTKISIERDHNSSKIIKIKAFLKLDKSKFGELSNVLDRFYNFDQWDSYVAGSNNINFIATEPRLVESTEELTRHFTHYNVKVPWPLRRLEVIDLVKYIDISDEFPDSLHSASFSSVPGFDDREGIKYANGFLHIALSSDQSYFVLYYITDVLPSISILLSKAAPYIEAALMDILLGVVSN